MSVTLLLCTPAWLHEYPDHGPDGGPGGQVEYEEADGASLDGEEDHTDAMEEEEDAPSSEASEAGE
jgi:hypothetical protein